MDLRSIISLKLSKRFLQYFEQMKESLLSVTECTWH